MKHTLSPNDYKLTTLDTCLLLESNAKLDIAETPFLLKCGEVLHVGDKFTRIDENGSAGNPPLHLDVGWYQEYRGCIDIHGYNSLQPKDRITRLLLFSAHKIVNGQCALKERKSKFLYQSICYIQFYNSLFYYNACNSSRVISCNSIKRFC